MRLQVDAIYIVTELAPTTLHSVVRDSILQESHVKFIGYQITVGLKYLHSVSVQRSAPIKVWW
jgi:serine/threonine protein kinase